MSEPSAQIVKAQKAGSFLAMNLSKPLLNALNRMNYKIPTPVQRKTLPIALAGMDAVCMARTGSGKTGAFLIPMIERLGCHENAAGVRGIILSPTRELAVQTFRFAKDMSKFTDLRVISVIGGDPLEKQFEALSNVPDVLVGTPGRLMHHLSEISTFKLNTVQFLVFDEADRLFEMGFAEQLNAIIKECPEDRQTMLFSATMPKQLVQFTRAGLREPQLIRLETDTKMSEELRMAFFTMRTNEKLAALLYLVRRIIPQEDMTIVFTATKHHSEYIHALFQIVGVTSTIIYGSMDQDARTQNLKSFRRGDVSYLIVTDVAARGIDVPLLNNVINLHFPPTSKLFVHRCGRAARQGRIGFAFSLVEPEETAFMADIHLFLDKKVTNTYGGNDGNEDREVKAGTGKGNVAGTSTVAVMKHSMGYTLAEMTPDMVHTGLLPQDVLDEENEFIKKAIKDDDNLHNLSRVADNGMKQYRRTRTEATHRGVSLAKKIQKENQVINIHPLICGEDPARCDTNLVEKSNFIRVLQTFRPNQTVLETGLGQSTGSAIVKGKGKKGKGSGGADGGYGADAGTQGVDIMKAMRKTTVFVLDRNKDKKRLMQESMAAERERNRTAYMEKDAHEENSDDYAQGDGDKDDESKMPSRVGPNTSTEGDVWAQLEAEAEVHEGSLRDDYEEALTASSKPQHGKQTKKSQNSSSGSGSIAKAKLPSDKPRLSVAERKKLKKAGGSSGEVSKAVQQKMTLDEALAEGGISTSDEANAHGYKDSKFYMPYGHEDEKQLLQEEVLQPKAGLRTAEAHAAAVMETALMDVAPEDAMDMNMKRRVQRWDEKKKKFVKQSLQEIAEMKGSKGKRMRSEQSGGTFGHSKSALPAGELYKKWSKRTRREVNTSAVLAGDVNDHVQAIPNFKINTHVKGELKNEEQLRSHQKKKEDMALKNMPKDKRKAILKARKTKENAKKKNGFATKAGRKSLKAIMT